MNFAKLSSKIILFFLTILFWGVSAGLAYFGVSILFTYEMSFDMVSYLHSILPAFVLIGVAILMLLIGIIGLCGVFTENRCLLGTFFFLLATLLSLEISSVVLVFLYRDHVNKYIKSQFDDVLDTYGRREAASTTHYFDLMQSKLHCCGQYNYTDWLHDSWWYKNAPQRDEDAQVPASCCVGYVAIDGDGNDDDDDVATPAIRVSLRSSQSSQYHHSSPLGNRVAAAAMLPAAYKCTGRSPQPIPADNYYQQGCFTKLKHLIREQFLYISGVLLALVIIQLTGLVSICILIMCRGSGGVGANTKRRNKQQPPYININTHEDVNYHL